jgi:hypothetical protein
MDYANHDLAHSLKQLEKYFHVRQKSEVLASVDTALKSLQNIITISREDQDSNLNTCRRLKRKSHSKFREWEEPITPIYYLNQSGEMTYDSDENDPSQLVLIFKSGSFVAEPKFDSNSSGDFDKFIRFLKEYRSFSSIFGFISAELTVSKQVRESIHAVIAISSKRYNHAFLKCKTLLGRKLKLKLGIGKGREGYIPFITWARGSLHAQLVNNLVFIDKLSQFKLCYGDN